jgi:ABC-type nickel/cobalt efflux system permease component RcnA
VKIAFIEGAIAQLPLLVLGDVVLTSLRQTKESAEKLYRFSQWASYFLYAIGVALGLYAALSGLKGLGVGE